MISTKNNGVSMVCPECDAASRFPEAQLIAGRPLRCPRCGAESLVSHDRDIPDNPPVWRLEQPDAGDERRPQVG